MERELTAGLLSKRASFRLIVSGPVGAREIERLIRKLELDKAILADEYAAAEQERDRQRQALQFYADENRYDYDAPCCPTPNNPGYKIPNGDVISDDGERAREALYGPPSPTRAPTTY